MWIGIKFKDSPTNIRVARKFYCRTTKHTHTHTSPRIFTVHKESLTNITFSIFTFNFRDKHNPEQLTTCVPETNPLGFIALEISKKRGWISPRKWRRHTRIGRIPLVVDRGGNGHGLQGFGSRQATSEGPLISRLGPIHRTPRFPYNNTPESWLDKSREVTNYKGLQDAVLNWTKK